MSLACEHVFGVTADEVRSDFTARLRQVLPEDRPLTHEALERAKRTGEEQIVTYRLRSPAGSLRHVEERVFPVRDPSGRLVGLESTSRELPHWDREQESARRRERLASIGTLATGIAHEINNPLGVILLGANEAQRVARSCGAGDRLDGLLELIKEHARRCGRVVDSVLKISRAERTSRGRTDLRGLVERVRSLSQAAAAEQGCSILHSIPDSAPAIMVNGTEIEQVLMNLINNSMDAGATRVVFSVGEGEGPSLVSLRVEDNGRGMDETELAHAFDPFFTSGPKKGGTGLGLSLCQGIVESHGGRMQMNSVEGIGTVVTIQLPTESTGSER